MFSFLYYTLSFRYASTVIDLSNINKDLNEHIKTIQEYTQEVRRYEKIAARSAK